MTEISRNGRAVAVHDLTPGAPADAPVVLMCHAAPGSGSFDPDPEVTAAAGIRLIEVDRPGYGGSDPVKDDFATIGLAAGDAAAGLADVLPAGGRGGAARGGGGRARPRPGASADGCRAAPLPPGTLNSSHALISYVVFCLRDESVTGVQ